MLTGVPFSKMRTVGYWGTSDVHDAVRDGIQSSLPGSPVSVSCMYTEDPGGHVGRGRLRMLAAGDTVVSYSAQYNNKVAARAALAAFDVSMFTAALVSDLNSASAWTAANITVTGATTATPFTEYLAENDPLMHAVGACGGAVTDVTLGGCVHANVNEPTPGFCDGVVWGKEQTSDSARNLFRHIQMPGTPMPGV